ncbi:MAG: replicative DNA helicase [Lentisphaeria bacterium]|nr:replicative DNA helicase [Lentisphaeria bacterium]
MSSSGTFLPEPGTDHAGAPVPAEPGGFSGEREENGRGNFSRSPSSSLADPDTEKAVIASLMLDPSALPTAASILGGLISGGASEPKKGKAPADVDSRNRDTFARIAESIFYDRKYAAIYAAILEMNEKDIGVDILSLSDKLERSGKLAAIGGQDFLIEVQNSIASTANIEAWCRILRDYAMLRELLRTCSSVFELCRNPADKDVKYLLDTVEGEFYNVRNRFVQPEIKELRFIADETLAQLLDVIDGKLKPGLPTEYPDLDRLLGGGMKPGEMIVLAARPSIGKTAMALNIIRNIIMKDTGMGRRNVAFFSLEMSALQVTQRLLCTEAQVPLSSIMTGTIRPGDAQKLTGAITELKKASLFIDPTAGLSVFELRAKARKLHTMKKLDLIAIDYLQLMKSGDAASSRESRQVEVAAISGGIKKLAKDLNIPILVLAQLNREGEKNAAAAKEAREPQHKLSNLRESGAIEQDADVVIFLDRKRDEAKDLTAEQSFAGVPAKLIVEKNRNGQTGVVPLKFRPGLMEFVNSEHIYERSEATPGQRKK